MCFGASNLSFCPKPFPVHGTPVDWNYFIWIFLLNTDLRVKCHCCGMWFKCCCYATRYIHAVCIFISGTAELSENTKLRYETRGMSSVSLDFSWSQQHSCFCRALQDEQCHANHYSFCGWLKVIPVSLHRLWSLKVFGKVYDNSVLAF